MFQTEEQIKREQQMEITRREMLRKSQDIIRIYNPLDFPFKYQWDGFWHSIPAQGTKDIPRFLANHFFKKIADYMIGQQMLKQGEELLALRENQLGKKFLDKYEENKEVWDRTPRLDDADLRRAVRDTVIIGIVEEYGFDVPAMDNTQTSTPVDFRPADDQLLSEIDNKIAPRIVETEERARPVNPFRKAVAQ